MLNIINRAPQLMNNTTPEYHTQYEAAIKHMFTCGAEQETDNIKRVEFCEEAEK